MKGFSFERTAFYQSGLELDHSSRRSLSCQIHGRREIPPSRHAVEKAAWGFWRRRSGIDCLIVTFIQVNSIALSIFDKCCLTRCFASLMIVNFSTVLREIIAGQLCRLRLRSTDLHRQACAEMTERTAIRIAMILLEISSFQRNTGFVICRNRLLL